jgi:hypothetical protein
MIHRTLMCINQLSAEFFYQFPSVSLHWSESCLFRNDALVTDVDSPLAWRSQDQLKRSGAKWWQTFGKRETTDNPGPIKSRGG